MKKRLGKPDINLLEPAVSKEYQKYLVNNQPKSSNFIKSQSCWVQKYLGIDIDDGAFIRAINLVHTQALKRWFRYKR